MKVYLVYGNYYCGGYGQEIGGYGIFATKEEAEKVREKVLEDIRNSCDPEWESPDEAWIEIDEMTVGEECDIHLGGYAE